MCYIYYMKFPKVRPEVDTVRFWFDISNYVRLDTFFEKECRRAIVSYQVELGEDGQPKKDEYGNLVLSKSWQKLRADMTKSWWCKMQITIEFMAVSKRVTRPVLSVEYSVAKWYNITNGVNRGQPFSRMDVLKPIAECLRDMHLIRYTHYKSNIAELMMNHVQLRRLDLSYNFKCDDAKRALIELSTCRLNNKDGKPIEKESNNETVEWGTTRGSLYKVMFYNKEIEQKRFFSLLGVDNTLDTERNKREFYKKHFEKFKNVVRFEVQYHSKYFLNHFGKAYKDNKDMDMLDKIVNLCEWNWGELLRKFDEQLGMSNVRPEQEYDLYQDAMSKIEKLRIAGGLSDTQAYNMKGFVEDCFKHSWMVVRGSMSQSLFSQKYNKVKKFLKLDLKRVCVTQLPIMRIMPSEAFSYQFSKNLSFKPAFIGSLLG